LTNFKQLFIIVLCNLLDEIVYNKFIAPNMDSINDNEC